MNDDAGFTTNAQDGILLEGYQIEFGKLNKSQVGRDNEVVAASDLSQRRDYQPLIIRYALPGNVNAEHFGDGLSFRATKDYYMFSRTVAHRGVRTWLATNCLFFPHSEFDTLALEPAWLLLDKRIPAPGTYEQRENLGPYQLRIRNTGHDARRKILDELFVTHIFSYQLFFELVRFLYIDHHDIIFFTHGEKGIVAPLLLALSFVLPARMRHHLSFMTTYIDGSNTLGRLCFVKRDSRYPDDAHHVNLKEMTFVHASGYHPPKKDWDDFKEKALEQSITEIKQEYGKTPQLGIEGILTFADRFAEHEKARRDAHAQSLTHDAETLASVQDANHVEDANVIPDWELLGETVMTPELATAISAATSDSSPAYSNPAPPPTTVQRVGYTGNGGGGQTPHKEGQQKYKWIAKNTKQSASSNMNSAPELKIDRQWPPQRQEKIELLQKINDNVGVFDANKYSTPQRRKLALENIWASVQDWDRDRDLLLILTGYCGLDAEGEKTVQDFIHEYLNDLHHVPADNQEIRTHFVAILAIAAINADKPSFWEAYYQPFFDAIARFQPPESNRTLLYDQFTTTYAVHKYASDHLLSVDRGDENAFLNRIPDLAARLRKKQFYDWIDDWKEAHKKLDKDVRQYYRDNLRSLFKFDIEQLIKDNNFM